MKRRKFIFLFADMYRKYGMLTHVKFITNALTVNTKPS